MFDKTGHGQANNHERTVTTKPLIAIVDYGIGNLHSAQKGFEHVGADARLTADRTLIDDADGVVLPGVGAFAACMDQLKRTGLDQAVLSAVASGRPFLGICVGMQVLFTESDEAPGTPGLGVFDRRVCWIPGSVKRPQMQWNILHCRRSHPMFAELDDPIWMYFVHSLTPESLTSDKHPAQTTQTEPSVAPTAQVTPTSPPTAKAVPGQDAAHAGEVIATCDYGGEVVAAVAHNNVWTAQFHPEKSSRSGLRILANFVAATTSR